MEVVNVKVQYIRPLGYNNLKDWMADPQNVYIGRRGIVFIDKRRFPQEDSIWRNPFVLGKDGNRIQVISKYKSYMKDRIQSGEITVQDLESLQNKRLGCWCAPEACHGEVLVELVQEHVTQASQQTAADPHEA